jgi:hypothetical protein
MPVPSAIECVSGENKRNQPTNTLCLLILLNHLFFVQCTRKNLLLSYHQVSTRVGVRTIRSLRWPCRSRDPRSGGTWGQDQKGRLILRREPRTPFFWLVLIKNTLDYISCVSSNVLSYMFVSSTNVLFLYLDITHSSMSVTVKPTFKNNLSVRLVLFII